MSKRPTAPQSAPMRITSVIPTFVHPKWVSSRLGLLAWHTLLGLAKRGHHVRAVSPFPDSGNSVIEPMVETCDGRLVIEYVQARYGKMGCEIGANSGRTITNSFSHDSQMLLCQGPYAPIQNTFVENAAQGKIPYAIHLHSEFESSDLRGKGLFGSRQVKKTWEPFFTKADTVMVQSEIHQKWINDWNWQIATSVIPSGLEKTIQELEVSKVVAKPYFVFAGDLTNGFDFSQIVEAFCRIDKLPDALKFVFMGKDEGGVSNLITKMAEKLGMPGRAHFLTSQSQVKRLSVLKSAAAIFPVISRPDVQRAIPACVLEAACMLKPCVLIGGTSNQLILETVANGACFAISNEQSKISEMLEKMTFDQDYRHELTTQARVWYRTHVHGDAVFNQLETVLRKMTLRAA